MTVLNIKPIKPDLLAVGRVRLELLNALVEMRNFLLGHLELTRVRKSGFG